MAAHLEAAAARDARCPPCNTPAALSTQHSAPVHPIDARPSSRVPGERGSASSARAPGSCRSMLMLHARRPHMLPSRARSSTLTPGIHLQASGLPRGAGVGARNRARGVQKHRRHERGRVEFDPRAAAEGTSRVWRRTGADAIFRAQRYSVARRRATPAPPWPVIAEMDPRPPWLSLATSRIESFG